MSCPVNCATTYLYDLGPVIGNDLLTLLIGKRLGAGSYRQVFEMVMDRKRVIKIEASGSEFCNIAEWDIWRSVEKTRWAIWFAPVHWISSSGLASIQSRCEPLAKMPPKVPDFFADVKLDNWGLLKGRPVCFDYGNHKFFRRAIQRARMVKPLWR